jgi:hypothetical protein
MDRRTKAVSLSHMHGSPPKGSGRRTHQTKEGAMTAVTNAAKRRQAERAWVYISKERKAKLMECAKTLEEKYPERYAFKMSMSRLASTLLAEAIDNFTP